MYTSYYGMSCNPFLKEVKDENIFESTDYNELINRFNYLKEIKGLGVFTGLPGYGKTFTVRSFINNLNKDLYKVIYISSYDNLTLFDFYKEVSSSLNLDTKACYKTDMYNNIQKAIKRLVEIDKVQPVIIIDDAHTLSRDILKSLKILFDFDMDSKDYTILILIGQDELKDELSKKIYETIHQRIIVNYKMRGLSREEVKQYIKTRFEISNVNIEIFTEDALNALYSCSKSSPRRLNTLILNCLMLGCQNRIQEINSEIVMEAKGEMDLD